MNGEHDAVAKAIVALAAVTIDDETGGIKCRLVVAREYRRQRLPRLWRVADAEARRDFAGEPARFQVLDGGRRVLEAGAIETRRGEQQFVQVLRFGAAFLLARTFVARHIQPRVACQFLHRIGK